MNVHSDTRRSGIPIITVDSPHVEPLPLDQWEVIFYPDCFAVAAYTNYGALFWTRFEYSELPSPKFTDHGDGSATVENQFGLGDLKGVIVKLFEGRTVL